MIILWWEFFKVLDFVVKFMVYYVYSKRRLNKLFLWGFNIYFFDGRNEVRLFDVWKNIVMI